METQRKTVTNPRNIGQAITKNDYNLLKNNYKKVYNDETSFIIPKALVEKNLNFHKDVVGIRFMYGLKDSLNPNSKVLFLIPCSSLSKNLSTESMLRKEGYQDHEGNFYTFQEVLLFMSQYIINVSKDHPEFIYKEITRGNFYGKDSLKSILVDNSKFVQYDLGYNGDHISPVIKALDISYVPVNEIYMDLTDPCPNMCGGSEICITTLAVEKFADHEDELNVYRAFRDYLMLDIEGGARLFEMYYFVSPVVAKIISNSNTGNDEIALNNFYKNEIIPFKLLLKNKQYDKALDALKDTLHNLFDQYEYSNLFA
ncbi:hypothetical protein [Kordia jejudonensis]|uniref:hypothetical protein n=1 Tax=Kordia jejudonensis TaxID=1348245 RepID=UPI0006299039|nr:hypothetical protein [Kordia jejudonensis]